MNYSKAQLEVIMEFLMCRLPANDQPQNVLLTPEELKETGWEGGGYYGVLHMMKFRNKDLWPLEQRIQKLEAAREQGERACGMKQSSKK